MDAAWAGVVDLNAVTVDVISSCQRMNCVLETVVRLVCFATDHASVSRPRTPTRVAST